MSEHGFDRLVKKTRIGVGGLNNSFRCKSCLSTCCSNSRVKRAYSELMSWRKLLFVKEYILSDNNGFKYTSITVWKVWNAIKKTNDRDNDEFYFMKCRRISLVKGEVTMTRRSACKTENVESSFATQVKVMLGWRDWYQKALSSVRTFLDFKRFLIKFKLTLIPSPHYS